MVAGALDQDHEALRAAALSSSRLRAPFQEVLYRTVELSREASRWDRPYSPSKVGLEVFKQSPILLTYISNVLIADCYNHSDSWTELDQHLPKLLSLLSKQRIESFSFLIEGVISRRRAPPPALQKALSLLIRCPTLQQLRVTNMPINVLNDLGSPHLGHLLLAYMRREGVSRFKVLISALRRAAAPSSPSQLETLEIGHDDAHIESIMRLSRIDVHVLKNLTLLPASDDWLWSLKSCLPREELTGMEPDVSPLLHACGPSLESLEFNSMREFALNFSLHKAYAAKLR